jgi:CheY-like chemotaxis protein
LAGGIAHDFNNLLQVVQGYAELLMLDKKEEDPGYRELQEVVKGARRGSELTRQLLTFSRKAESDLRPVNLNFEVDKTRRLLERTIPKMIAIEPQLAPDVKIVNADPTQVEQVLVNLAVNAKDAMPDGGKLIIQTENVTLDEKYCRTHPEAKAGEHVLLSVSDTGRGIDRETMAHIFDPFYTTKGLAEGTGLGLAMVYGIVKSHGGHITCSSEPGVGSTFGIYFPTIEQEVESEKKVDFGLPQGGTETILLIDDEELIRDLGKETLTAFGYKVLTASDGESGLELYKKEQKCIDLVVLDLIMPGMSGRRCLDEFLSINPKVKVIVASGYSDNGPMQETIEAGAKSFIGKPYQTKQFLKIIRDVIDGD